MARAFPGLWPSRCLWFVAGYYPTAVRQADPYPYLISRCRVRLVSARAETTPVRGVCRSPCLGAGLSQRVALQGCGGGVMGLDRPLPLELGSASAQPMRSCPAGIFGITHYVRGGRRGGRVTGRDSVPSPVGESLDCRRFVTHCMSVADRGARFRPYRWGHHEACPDWAVKSPMSLWVGTTHLRPVRLDPASQRRF